LSCEGRRGGEGRGEWAIVLAEKYQQSERDKEGFDLRDGFPWIQYSLQIR
jgi:hypothetical protein